MSYLGQNNRKEAQKALERAVSLDDKNADLRAGLAFVYLVRNNLSKASTEARASLALSPNIAEAHYVLGVIGFRGEFFYDAYARAEKAVEINPKLASAYLLKSKALVSSLSAQAGKGNSVSLPRGELLKEAVADLEKFLTLAPNNKEAGFYREHLRSLKFFSEYYSQLKDEKKLNAELQKHDDNADASSPLTTTTTSSSRTQLRIMSKPQAAYTGDAREANVSGTVRLLVTFGADGKIGHILVLRDLDYGLTEQAVKAARAIKFEPVTENGKPVSSVRTIEYTFTIF